ncbi:hypothetical protein BT96DRAFT_391996 [Gymnopus androsaceus JB14]|uniref:Uncharacterized protein n=1 Tax=Gymnopus androsaceus JB14 TaxID=1447944 RepID=A0A6A4GW51_9AGAR|nr:hypothetical protein BT96DRAFT_391996 [Gymnopus androsaceus JB14]
MFDYAATLFEQIYPNQEVPKDNSTRNVKMLSLPMRDFSRKPRRFWMLLKIRTSLRH